MHCHEANAKPAETCRVNFFPKGWWLCLQYRDSQKHRIVSKISDKLYAVLWNLSQQDAAAKGNTWKLLHGCIPTFLLLCKSIESWFTSVRHDAVVLVIRNKYCRVSSQLPFVLGHCLVDSDCRKVLFYEQLWESHASRDRLDEDDHLNSTTMHGSITHCTGT